MKLNPTKIKAYDKAQQIKMKARMIEAERLAYMNGFYVLNALGASFGHGEYPKEPVGMFSMNEPEDDKPLTEEQIKEKRKDLFAMLSGMQQRFEENKKELSEE